MAEVLVNIMFKKILILVSSFSGLHCDKILSNKNKRNTPHTSSNIIQILCPSHRLRGSASPVLTATAFVNGKGQFSTPQRIDTPQPITKNLSRVIKSATPTAVPNQVHIRPRGGFWAHG